MSRYWNVGSSGLSKIAGRVEAAVQTMARAGARITKVDRVCRDPFRTYMVQAGLRLRSTKRTAGEPRAVPSATDGPCPARPMSTGCSLRRPADVPGAELARFRAIRR